jgi:hypothetical protein
MSAHILRWVKIVSGSLFVLIACYNIAMSIAIALLDYYVLDLGPLFVSMFSLLVTVYFVICFVLALVAAESQKCSVSVYLAVAFCFFGLQLSSTIFLFLFRLQSSRWVLFQDGVDCVLELVEIMAILLFCALLVRSFSNFGKRAEDTEELKSQSVPLRYSNDNY